MEEGDTCTNSNPSTSIFACYRSLGCKNIGLTVKDAGMAVVAVIYLSLIGIVFKYRDHPGVRSRSPTLILVGGVALLADSMMNFMIQISNNDGCQCFIGIFTTVVFHYTAWFSIFLRAFRIGRFFDIYERYLDNAESQQMQMSYLRLTLPMEQEEEEEDLMLEDFRRLKEINFLKKHMLVFISTISTVGICSFFYPYLYAVVPVYET